jgi:hypothetical protein
MNLCTHTLVSVELISALECTEGPEFSSSTVPRESITWPVERAAPTGLFHFLVVHHVQLHTPCLDGCWCVALVWVPYTHKKDVPFSDICGNACCPYSARL